MRRLPVLLIDSCLHPFLHRWMLKQPLDVFAGRPGERDAIGLEPTSHGRVEGIHRRELSTSEPRAAEPGEPLGEESLEPRQIAFQPVAVLRQLDAQAYVHAALAPEGLEGRVHLRGGAASERPGRRVAGPDSRVLLGDVLDDGQGVPDVELVVGRVVEARDLAGGREGEEVGLAVARLEHEEGFFEWNVERLEDEPRSHRPRRVALVGDVELSWLHLILLQYALRVFQNFTFHSIHCFTDSGFIMFVTKGVDDSSGAAELMSWSQQPRRLNHILNLPPIKLVFRKRIQLLLGDVDPVRPGRQERPPDVPSARRVECRVVQVLEQAEEDGDELVAVEVRLGAVLEEDVALVDEKDRPPPLRQLEDAVEVALDGLGCEA
ncbi:unnamed protein product [Clonostachys byssicola]|uniref:Uncharacterized protein n=1 Tax=Clonostachys byssicola TaxID=160290 RepID=A0A9N9UYU5_9HYPO|nr:unnamed protein product [Clonostachys byssicola]